jgi:hypothetical protein
MNTNMYTSSEFRGHSHYMSLILADLVLYKRTIAYA